jgi:hypothetical protein
VNAVFDLDADALIARSQTSAHDVSGPTGHNGKDSFRGPRKEQSLPPAPTIIQWNVYPLFQKILFYREQKR